MVALPCTYSYPVFDGIALLTTPILIVPPDSRGQRRARCQNLMHPGLQSDDGINIPEIKRVRTCLLLAYILSFIGMAN
ncbi:hypothetical protein M404DRAFT_1008841 [Pisolithus tinctorius Marx 270]|uniref:Uncharacterized protein n=1 Tax=Pisolithus tinctorius Marx 270 TaxID=870435 RepID=A0A0C3J7D1_PISTI|nr:hypothetical protein M404DRAFT_1008841 [Pisolithus tinctorius Marx 270]